MKNILVIGGAGYIGRQIVKILNKKKYNIHVIDNLSITKINYLNKSTKFSKIDILNEFVQIAQLFIEINLEKDGLEILNKVYPLIMQDLNEKGSKELWKPNTEDSIISNIYLDLAENYFQNQSDYELALIGAYDLLQASFLSVCQSTDRAPNLDRALPETGVPAIVMLGFEL